MRCSKSVIGLTIGCAVTVAWATAAPPNAKNAPKGKTPPATKSTGSGKAATPAKGAKGTVGDKSKSADAKGKYALLVGCTKYPNMPITQLTGPAHDVELMSELLQKKFGFKADHIVTLAEAQPEDHHPTRANIEREFKAIAKKARKGDDVVILLSGHGTQQPDSDPPNPDDPEPDGLDEVFLPSDARLPEGDSSDIPNGLVDDDLGNWVAAIRNQGATVWITIDSCHSGTILRGATVEVERRVDPELIIPREAMAAARRRAAALPKSRGEAKPETSLAGDLTNIVAIYAAQPDQLTVEMPLPKDSDQPQSYGLLTYTISKVLMEAQSTMSYSELVERVQSTYVQSGRTTPTPLIEGLDTRREVLGVENFANRSNIKLSKKDATLQINAGAVHGMTGGSVLRVFPPSGAKNSDKAVGHVRIASLASLTADVAPCEFEGAPVNMALPVGGRCELVYLDAGLRPMRVAVDVSDSLRALATDEVAQLAKRYPLVAPAADRSAADWILFGEKDKTTVKLEPASGIDAKDPKTTPSFGPVELDDKFSFWLEDHVRRISRAQNLLSLVHPSIGEKQAQGLNLVIELVRFKDNNDKTGEPIAWNQAGIVLNNGDSVGCRIKNCGKSAADATLLFVDSGSGITAVFPKGGLVTENRIFPGESTLAFRARVNDKTAGLEHLVLIGVPGQGAPIDFGSLEQPTLALARGDKATRSMSTPLGRLMENALYSSGTKRGLDLEEFDQQQFELVSWRVATGDPKTDKP